MAALPLGVETMRSAPRRPVAQCSADRVAAYGVGGERAVPARSGISNLGLVCRNAGGQCHASAVGRAGRL